MLIWPPGEKRSPDPFSASTEASQASKEDAASTKEKVKS